MPDLQSRAERALDALSFFASDARYGLGAYLGVYLMTEHAWDAASIGAALSVGMLTGLVSQAPLGALVDAIRAKRALIAGAVLVVTATCLVIPLSPVFWTVATAGLIGALAGVTIGPTLAALGLGIVGPARFARRAGRNEALFHAGDGFLSLVVLLLAPVFGSPVLFWSMAVTASAAAASAAAIPKDAIDHDVARGLLPQDAAHGVRPSAWGVLLSSRPLLVFAFGGALFTLANASMLGLVAQKMSVGGSAGQGLAMTAAFAIAAQAVMVPVAWTVGARADAWGRRPLLVAAFAVLALRGMLHAASDDLAWTIGVQLLDGVGAGLMGALFPIVVADLTRGSGHFAAAQGAVATVHGLGGVVSMTLGGLLVLRFGYDAAFLTLAAIAAFGAVVFWALMPETRPGLALAGQAVPRHAA